MRARRDAFDARVPGVIIHTRNMVYHLQVFGWRFQCSHKMGKDRALHRMLEARDTVYLPIFFDGLYRALLLANVTICRTSSVILFWRVDRS